jgi:flagellar FliJ protein
MFKFRLASVLKLREYHERHCKEYLAKCLHELRDAEQKRRGILETIGRQELELQTVQTGKINIPYLKRLQEYLQYQRELLFAQNALVEQKRADLFKARQKLILAMKEKKILEKLQEKQYDSYLESERKREQDFLDDLAGRK